MTCRVRPFGPLLGTRRPNEGRQAMYHQGSFQLGYDLGDAMLGVKISEVTRSYFPAQDSAPPRQDFCLCQFRSSCVTSRSGVKHGNLHSMRLQKKLNLIGNMQACWWVVKWQKGSTNMPTLLVEMVSQSLLHSYYDVYMGQKWDLLL